MRRIRNRIYSDFVMRSRLPAYGQLLELALDAGYRICSVGEAWRLITAGGLVPTDRYIVLRHDVDTDPRTAAAMWESIEVSPWRAPTSSGCPRSHPHSWLK